MKDRLTTPLVYHPACTVLVDDNPRFLSTFRLQIRTRTPLHTLDSPLAALEGLALQADIGPLEPDNALQRLTDPKRFELYSTLIVDYDMPEMTGLDLCRKLAGRPINRILLTGKADESHAVEAFNQGLIHRFVRKGDPDVGERINRYLGELGWDYFRRLSSPHALSEGLDALDLFYTQSLARTMERLYAELRLVEHYYVAEPPGILLMNAKGQVWLMLLLPQTEAKVHLEIAESEGAPQELLQILQQGEQATFFPSKDGYFRKDWSDSWKQYLYPARSMEAVDGEEPCRYVLLEREAIPDALLEGMTSFSDFRAARRKSSQAG